MLSSRLSFALLLAVVLALAPIPGEARGSCSRCSHCERPRPEPCPDPWTQITFLGQDASSENDDGAFDVDAELPTQSYPAGTAGVSSGVFFVSNVPVTQQQRDRRLAWAAWPASRSGKLKNLVLNVLYVNVNGSAIHGSFSDIGNVSVSLWTAKPSQSFVQTELAASTTLNFSPSLTNLDAVASNYIDRVDIASGTRTAALLTFGWTPRAVAAAITGEFWISGGYVFEH